MKKLTVVSIVFLMALQTHAQQKPYYTQYILNDFIINPALAGIENYWDAKVSHRHQWVGLDGSPVTTYATIQGPLEKSGFARETPVTVHAQGENPRGAAYYQNYQAPRPHFGLGFTVINDATGPLNNFEGYATLAYHLPVGEKTTLSSAISVGIQNTRLDASMLNFGTAYPVDPAVAGSGYLNKINPDISAGVFLYSANYFVGLSALQIVPEKIVYGNDKLALQNGKLIPHLFLQAGYRCLLTEDINFLPSVTLKYITPTPVSIDINAKLQYRDFLWVGGSYRPNNGFAAMLGLNINSTINIGYSYDITTTQLNTVSNGTHEILVGFLIGNKNDDWCPRNVY
jgi:type IX secretion system PorP/SprF family membrane protein